MANPQRNAILCEDGRVIQYAQLQERVTELEAVLLSRANGKPVMLLPSESSRAITKSQRQRRRKSRMSGFMARYLVSARKSSSSVSACE